MVFNSQLSKVGRGAFPLPKAFNSSCAAASRDRSSSRPDLFTRTRETGTAERHDRAAESSPGEVSGDGSPMETAGGMVSAKAMDRIG